MLAALCFGGGFSAHAADGDFVWAKAMGGTGDDFGHGVALDSSGNVYTTGYFTGTADFDPGAGIFNLGSAGSDDIFVSKLDSSGAFVWAKAMGGTDSDRGFSIAVDSSGNVYTTGYFVGTADFDPGAGTSNLGSAGGSDIFVSKLDSSGAFVWAKAMGGTAIDEGKSIAVDSSGNVYTTGYFFGTADFDPGAGTFNLTPAGSGDIFVSKLDTSGAFVWAKALGGTSDDIGYGIAVDGSGNVYTTGYFFGTADFDPGAGTSNLTSAGSADIFVSKLSGPDVIAPNATAVTPSTTGPTNADSVSFTVDFDEDVQNFNAAADVVVAHSGTASTGVTITGGPSSYSVDVTGISGDGTFTLAASAVSDVQDLAGNPLASSVTSAAVNIDNTGPGISIGAPSASATNTGPVSYTVTYTGANAVTLANGNVSLNATGGASGTIGVSGTGTSTRTVTITGISGNGTLGISILSGTASDTVGNLALAAGPSGTFAVDNTAPTIVLSSTDPEPASAAISVTATLSQSSVNFAAGDVTPTNAAVSGFAGGGTSYSFTLTPTAAGVFSAVVNASMFTDAATNANTASNVLSRTYSVSISVDPPGSIQQGDVVELTAPAGTGHQWKRNNINVINNAPRVTGATAQVLRFDTVLASDSGTYTVQYDNGAKAIVTSPPFVLFVAAPPEATPAAGVAGLALLSALMVGAYAVTRRKQ